MTAAQLSERLEQTLGERLPSVWREAYRAVPRHLFLPDRAHRAARGDSASVAAIDRATDPSGWLAAAYSEDVIITQRDARGRSTSSCPMPYLVFTMLELLDVQPGHRVLEIGTGTGWNAGLLAYRLGGDRVVSVEVDPEVADGARRALASAGLHPLVVTADGAEGYRPGARYDRVIATCTVHRVPYRWVEQTRPGGLIVTPLGAPLDPGGIAQLTVAAGGTASGRFQLGSSFMPLRAQRFEAPDEPDDFADRAATSTTEEPVARVLDGGDSEFAAAFMVPDCKTGCDRNDEGYIVRVWLLAADSWASVDVASGVVRQLGRRRLWDEVEAAYRWWVEVGSPELTRFGVTVTGVRQWVWLDDPGQPVGPEALRGSDQR